ncbi:chemotaxis protein CheA [Leptospira bourretii]|uniref:Chemotaxis protein CheA n=1 Tax=Leptospira bourretii TaxID=2484962 RepID=A0A4V3JKY1_9LEPT|nr:chemotaxis protein CheA [Leptospira bourretii]TGK88273.1 chemotaxis protein CheA [Leptospira bourretii]TGK88923.1 chemotaxis protein CheA [Leptospira bourretii]TGL21212.1 chemotaxis protein CheA [Leptospira bourretii]TGL33306.1 chemotaxis protein CheA [Leptospira bourretii]
MGREQLLLDFIPEGFELIEVCESAILSIEEINDQSGEYDEDLINNLFRAVHTFKGSTGLLKLESLVKISHEAETLMDILRKEKKFPNEDICQVLINTCDQLRRLLHKVDETKSNPELDDESDAIIEVLKREIKQLNSENQITESEIPIPKKKKSFEIFGEEEPKTETTVTRKKPAFEIFGESPNTSPTESKITNEHYHAETNNPEKKTTEIIKPEKTQLDKEPIATTATIQKKEIKVANEKLDALMDLVGELVIAESNVTQHPLLKSLRNEDFNSSINRLHKIVLDLQEVALSTRMIPISGVFQKMSRLVRDLQKKANKKVALYISGEETEIDKSIVDLIADPIIHILRNSIDHGIETNEERMLYGKAEVGTIQLSARQSVNEVWVMIRDDGRGLNREKIIQKSIERGILSGDTEHLSDQEVYNLIFVPGLSTAETITDISGRGVGMDIVRQNIEKMGGKIEIHSRLQKGTSFILRIPLSLGIMEGTVVRIGKKFFTIQTIELREFVSLREKKEIPLEDNQKVIDVRGTFIPIFDINQILNHREEIVYEGLDPLMIVLEYEKKLLGIRVDEIVGNQNVVIKPLQGILEEANGVNGFTILGSGNVSLILDVKSIFQKMHRSES